MAVALTVLLLESVPRSKYQILWGKWEEDEFLEWPICTAQYYFHLPLEMKVRKPREMRRAQTPSGTGTGKEEGKCRKLPWGRQV